ncbi:DUF736 domain-containing protein [Novosphingobium sp. 9]|uniref:DUF736 domain-containing protein n=1 Tax=Novosphingobium sp. 9 TaxID=2025349 RepID=UPI0021B65176|nr:DUF736 domain-containing protein [Novosphingobium sp. 9]
MRIGTFTPGNKAFAGRLQTLTLDLALRIVVLEGGTSAAAPDWRILAGEGRDEVEVGVAWNNTSAAGVAFLAVQLQCPALPRPIRARLLPPRDGNGDHVLHWSPRARGKESS